MTILTRRRKAMTTVILAVMVLSVTAVAGIGGLNNSYVSAAGIPITSADELAKIGKDPGYPLDGDYYLDSDIDFAGINTNGGLLLRVTYTNDVPNAEFHVEYSSDDGATWADAPNSMYAANSDERSLRLSTSGTVRFAQIHAPSAPITSTDYVNTLYVYGKIGTEFVAVAFDMPLGSSVGTDMTADSNGNFDPIGFNGPGIADSVFTGTFDGNGHTISNLDIAVYTDTDNGNNVGLFAHTDRAVLKNISLESGRTIGYSGRSGAVVNVGSIVGEAYNTELIDSSNGGPVWAWAISKMAVGGLIGSMWAERAVATTDDGAHSLMSGCVNHGKVTGGSDSTQSEENNPSIGGLVGNAKPSRNGNITIKNSTNNGPIVTYAPRSFFAGGIIGHIWGEVMDDGVPNEFNNLINNGEMFVSGLSGAAGGLVGFVRADGTTGNAQYLFEDCYNTARITGIGKTAFDTSGLFGQLYGDRNSAHGSVVNRCFNTGDIYAAASSTGALRAGGLAAYTNSAEFNGCFNAGTITVFGAQTGSPNTDVGGLIGTADRRSDIAGSYNKGDIVVSGPYPARIGGMIGHVIMYNQPGTGAMIEDGYAVGEIRSSASGAYVGGLVGTNVGSISGMLDIRNCYVSGSFAVSGPPANLGALIGMSTYTSVDVRDTYFLTGLVPGDALVGSGGYRINNSGPGTDAELRSAANYANWDFSDSGPWGIWEGSDYEGWGYPYIKTPQNHILVVLDPTTGTIAPDPPSFSAGSNYDEDMYELTGDLEYEGFGAGTVPTGHGSYKVIGGTLELETSRFYQAAYNVGSFVIPGYTVTPSADSNSTIDPSTAQTVDSGENVTFTFSANVGCVMLSVLIDGVEDVTALAAGTYTFSDIQEDHTISVTSTQVFTVTPSADANSTIDPSTAQTIESGESVTFTFSAGSGYVLSSVLIDGVADDVALAAGTYTFSAVAADHTIAVNSIQTFTITPSADANSAITPSTVQTVESGEDITFTFSANAGYALSSVLIDGVADDAALAAGTYTFSAVAADHTIAVTSVQTFTITPSADSNSTIDPSTVQTIRSGENVTFTFSANTGYALSSVLIDGVADDAALASGTYTFSAVAADHTIAVNSVQMFTITPSADPNSTIDPSTVQTIESGENLTFTFSANTGYVLSSVLIDGVADDVALAAGTYTFSSVAADHTIAVNSIQTFTITPSVDANSTITPSTIQTVESGEDITFIFSANTGYALFSVLIDGVADDTALAAGTYTFSDVQADHTISVAGVQTFTITPSADSNSTIDPSAAQTIEFGENLTFTFSVDTGYELSSVIIDGVADDAALATGTYTFLDVQADHTIAVTSVQTFTVTPSADANSTIDPPTIQTIGSGEDVTFTFSANTGYALLSILIDGVADDAALAAGTYTFSAIAADHTIAITSVQTFTITPSADANSTIDPSTMQTIESGEDVTFTFSANAGYVLSSVLIDGVADDAALAAGIYTFSNVQSDHTISVTTAQTFTITPSADSNSTIDPSTVQAVIFGESLTFTFSADTGYELSSVIIDGVADDAALAAGTYTFSNVQSNHTILVTTAQTFTITPSADVNSVITPSTIQTVESGENLTFTFSANYGYALLSVLIDGVADATALVTGTYTFSDVRANHIIDITATSVPSASDGNDLTITAVADAGSSVDPDGSVAVSPGGSVTFAYSAKPGYVIVSVLIDGIDDHVAVLSGSYTFENVRSNHDIFVYSEPGSMYVIVDIVGGKGTPEYHIGPSSIYTRFNGEQPVAYNADVYVTIDLADGYGFVKWTGEVDSKDIELHFPDVTHTIYLTAHLESGSGTESDGEWSPLNMICAVVAFMAGIVALVGGRGRTKDGDGEHRSYVALALRIASIVVGVISLVVFFLTEDWTLPVIPIDEWTLLMFILFLISVVVALTSYHFDKDEEDESTEYEPEEGR